jgi:hypothetical protein
MFFLLQRFFEYLRVHLYSRDQRIKINTDPVDLVVTYGLSQALLDPCSKTGLKLVCPIHAYSHCIQLPARLTGLPTTPTDVSNRPRTDRWFMEIVGKEHVNPGNQTRVPQHNMYIARTKCPMA